MNENNTNTTVETAAKEENKRTHINVTATEAKRKNEERPTVFKRIAKFFLDSKKITHLILKSLLLLAIPYIYLILCGFLFDRWLKLYAATSAIFYSLIVLYIIAIAIIVYAIVRFIRARGKK